jgi:hypothetical protein
MKFLSFCVVLAAVLSISACDWEWENDEKNNFASHLQGTWVSNDPSVYDGTLEITFTHITITGYSESQTPNPGGNDAQRPFRNFTKRVSLNGYSEDEPGTNGRIEGQIFIEDVGVLQAGIPYTYWYTSASQGFSRTHFLRFSFGDRDETLQRTE